MAIRHNKPPVYPDKDENRIRIFFGGSIELGVAEEWQEKLAEYLADKPYAARIDIYNPRRGGPWKTEWMDNYGEGPFREQVEWELHYQKKADLIIYYFAADTISPITLLELGLFHDKKPVIGVDPAYKRIGNIMVTKDHFPMDVSIGWDEFIKALDDRLEKMLDAAPDAKQGQKNEQEQKKIYRPK